MYCAAFLKDPERKVARYSMMQSKRAHLEYQLAYCSDVTYTTERISTPHTLVVTKNQRSHEAKIQIRIISPDWLYYIVASFCLSY